VPAVIAPIFALETSRRSATRVVQINPTKIHSLVHLRALELTAIRFANNREMFARIEDGGVIT